MINFLFNVFLHYFDIDDIENIKLDDIFGFSLYFGDFKEIFFNRNFHKNIKIMYTLPEIKNPSAYQLNKLIDENLLITANFYENVEKYDKNCGIIYENIEYSDDITHCKYKYKIEMESGNNDIYDNYQKFFFKKKYEINIKFYDLMLNKKYFNKLISNFSEIIKKNNSGYIPYKYSNNYFIFDSSKIHENKILLNNIKNLKINIPKKITTDIKNINEIEAHEKLIKLYNYIKTKNIKMIIKYLIICLQTKEINEFLYLKSCLIISIKMLI